MRSSVLRLSQLAETESRILLYSSKLTVLHVVNIIHGRSEEQRIHRENREPDHKKKKRTELQKHKEKYSQQATKQREEVKCKLCMTQTAETAGLLTAARNLCTHEARQGCAAPVWAGTEKVQVSTGPVPTYDVCSSLAQGGLDVDSCTRHERRRWRCGGQVVEPAHSVDQVRLVRS